MITITCDACRKKLDNPITQRDFFYFAEFSVCEDCRDKMEAQIKPTVRTKAPYAIDWYAKLIRDNLSKAVSRGR